MRPVFEARIWFAEDDGEAYIQWDDPPMRDDTEDRFHTLVTRMKGRTPDADELAQLLLIHDEAWKYPNFAESDDGDVFSTHQYGEVDSEVDGGYPYDVPFSDAGSECAEILQQRARSRPYQGQFHGRDEDTYDKKISEDRAGRSRESN